MSLRLPSPRARLPLALAVAIFCLAVSGWWRSRPTPGPQMGADTQPGVLAVPAMSRADAPPRDAVAKPVRAVLPKSAAPALAAFNDWAARFFAATPEQRSAMTGEGRALAQGRRAEFLKMIAADPRRALLEAVPPVVRQDLPAEITALLEERVNASGTLTTYMSKPVEGAVQPPVLRYARTADGREYQAHAFGRDQFAVAEQTPRSLIGVALPDENGKVHLALSDSRVRRLEAGERPDPALPKVSVCPVSGKTTALASEAAPITDATPAVEAGGRIVYLCDGSHTTVFDEQLIYGEGSTGGPQRVTGNFPHSTGKSVGVLRVIYVPLTFLDQNATPASEAVSYDVMRQVSDYYQKQSYGKITIQTTVTPPVRLPHTEAWYIAKDAEVDGLGLEHSDALTEARKLGYDSNDYDCRVVRLNGGPRATGGWGGGSSIWTYYDAAYIVAHEMGHTFGLAHANYWDTGGASTIGAGASQEYGDQWDVMGGGGTPNGHYNIWAKGNVNWLPGAQLWDVKQSGTYRIYAHDANTLEPARRYGMKITKDSARTYYIESRQLYDSDANKVWLKYGATLEWRWSAKGGNNLLLDTTPGSLYGKDDGGLVLGKTFSDREAGLHVTPVAVNFGAQKSVDLVVNTGQFPGNSAPALALNASALTVPAGTAVTFTATATDADGDTLAYFWQSGDKSVYANSAQLVKTFASAGQYWIACTVSDMKGGTATRYAVVNVGAHSQFSIGGRVTLGGVGLPDVLVKTASKQSVTDTDGYYTIAGLTAGAQTVALVREGYAFTGTTAFTVGPSVVNADFTAGAGNLLTLTASVPATAEGSATPGRFTFTRSGDPTAALTVQVETISGTATAGDYTLTPAVATNTFTIPAGQASLDVTVAAVDDASAEGPETLTLQLVPDAAYVISGLGEATVTIGDNDTVLPLVSIAATLAHTVENDPAPAQFTVTRAGPTAAALTVSYTISGTATNGADYATLPGTVTIPIGAASAPILVSTLNDALNEGSETVTLTLASNAAYLIGTSAATVTIVDDDEQIITVTAADPNAAEVGSGPPPDPGVFLITRTGSTTLPLIVYYSLAGTAIHGVDFEILPGSVTIPAGQSSAAVTILPINDGLGEGPETVQFLLASVGTNYQLGDTSTATVTIADNVSDPASLEVFAVDGFAQEGGDTGKFRITARGGSGAAITVGYAMSGTALNGTDYTALSGTATLPAGTGTRTVDVTITPTQDANVEPIETVTLTLTSGAGYALWAQSKTATMWLRDDDAPTVFADAHRNVPTEAGTASSFYISRVGATTGALDVNFTLTGTATNGVDYVAIPLTATIPAAAAGVDIAVTPINDALAEGTETIILTLAPGSYSPSPEPAVLYLTDDETPAPVVQFAKASAAGQENAGTVNVPVALAGVLSGPATVEYAISSGTSTSASTLLNKATAPYWVRVVRAGSTFTSYHSPDGATWTQQGAAQTIALPTTSYHVGLGVCAYNNAAICTAVFDNVTVTGLDAGATQGAAAGVDIGTVGFPGSFSESGGTWTVNGSGTDVEGTTDHFYYARWLVSNSVNCTITARVASVSNTNTKAMAGVMIRENSAANTVRYAYTVATATSGLAYEYRTAAAGNNASSFSPNFTLPYWVRLVRAGDMLTAWRSADGLAWAQHGAAQQLAMGNPVLAGLAVCSVNDGTLATGVFDNVTVTGGSGAWLSRDIGNTAAAGSSSQAAGTFTVLGSGADIFGSGDEFRYVWQSLAGDGSITARVVSLTNTSASAKAGVMIREDLTDFSRHALMAMQPDGDAELIVRASGRDTAFGAGVDFTLAGGVLTFNPGDTVQNIALTIIDDAVREFGERIIIKLKNPNGLTLGAQTEFTYSIGDNDGGLDAPVYVGFVRAADSALEAAGTVTLPVTLTRAADVNVTVNYAVTGGSATQPDDFTLASGTLTFTPGETAKNIVVPLADDAIAELDETFTVTLSAPSGASLDNTPGETFTILNDDGTPTVTIVSPAENIANIPAGVGLVLSATTQHLGASPGAVWSKVSGPGTVTIGPAALGSTAQFSATGTYVLRVTASSGALNATADLTVNVGLIQYPFAAQDVGGPTPAGSHTFSGGTYSIAAGSSANGIPSNLASDGFYFLAEPASGDVQITARVVSVANTNSAGSSSRAGVMIRQSLAADDLEAFVGITAASPAGGRFIWRSTSGAISANSTATTAQPYWVRLIRTGSSFTAQIAADSGGTPGAFVAIGSAQTIAMTGPVYVGLASTSGSAGFAGAAVIDHVTLSPVLANVGPLVNAGPNATVTTATAALTGTASDDAKPTPPGALTSSWSVLSGPGAVDFANANALATTATFATNGLHTLRLTASDGAITTFDDTDITADVPTVTVAATDSVAAEWGANPGVFTFTRSGSTAAPLVVNFTLSGSANETADYAAVGTSVTIPIGAASAPVAIAPVLDALVEGPETVILTLATSANYLPGASTTGLVTIADRPADAWRFTHFGLNAGNPAIAGDLADPDSDGVVNLLEYAQNLDPQTAGTAPTVGLEAGYITLTYRRNLAAVDLTYTVQEAASLLAPTPWTTATVLEEILSDDGTTRVIKAKVVNAAQLQRYLRLKIIRN